MKTKFTIFGIITLALLSYGLYVALIVTPTEATMGPIQRIFYYHLPAAFLFFVYFFANFVASIWYLVATSILTVGQYYVERHYARGSVRNLPPTPPEKFREFFLRNFATRHRVPAIPDREARGGGA